MPARSRVPSGSHILFAVLLVTLMVAACGDDPAPLDVTRVDESGPLLVALSVGGGRGLNPRFDPSVRRYSIVAEDQEGDSVWLLPLAIAGSQISVNGVSVQTGMPQALQVSPSESLTISVSASFAEAEETYEILYLPPDFPEFSVSHHRETPSDEVTYLSVGNWLIMLDDFGVPVYYRREEWPVTDFKLHPSGERSYAVRTGEVNSFGQRMHEIVVLDEEFREIDRVTTVGLNHTDNHDFLIRENGNYVLLAYHGEVRDLSATGGSVGQEVVESVVQELTRARDVVFEWRSFDEIPVAEALRDWTDYAHVNSVFEHPSGDYIISMRGVSQVARLDRETESVLWKMGGVSNEFSFLDDPYSNLCGQHTASILGNGNLLIFDNGQLCFPEDPARGQLTRVVEYEINEVARTARLVWSYSRPDTYTLSAGSAQRLGNGNTLIGWGRGPDVMGTEVTPAGDIVWELAGTVDGEGVRSYRVVRARR